MIIQSVIGVIAGLFILVVSVLSFWAYSTIVALLSAVPVVGKPIVDWTSHFFFPAGQLFLPALGVFVIVWAVALGARRSWARLVGIALYVLVIAHLIALALLFLPFWGAPLVMGLRWWIAGVWAALVALFLYLVYYLAEPKTEARFAAPYLDKQVVEECDRCKAKLNQSGRCPNCDLTAEELQGRTAPPRQREEPPGREVPGTAPGKAGESDKEQRVLARLVGAEGQSHEMRAPQLTVGRGPDNDVVLEDRTVSEHHAKIFYQDGQFAIQDLASSNGTFVNGTKVERSRLDHDCRIEIGRVAFVFEVAQASE